MIAASFCPLRTRSAVSIRLINESDPAPRTIGRSLGRFAFCDEGTSTCDHAASTTNNKTADKTARARMGLIRNRNLEDFQPLIVVEVRPLPAGPLARFC